MVAHRPPTVYLAARSEDRDAAAALRLELADLVITCTARWLDVADLSGINGAEAEMCFTDIVAADVFVLLSRQESFRDSTGGHHVETGIAITLGKPIVLYGEPQNVFHGLSAVNVVSRSASVNELAAVVHRLSRARNARGEAITGDLRI